MTQYPNWRDDPVPPPFTAGPRPPLPLPDGAPRDHWNGAAAPSPHGGFQPGPFSGPCAMRQKGSRLTHTLVGMAAGCATAVGIAIAVGIANGLAAVTPSARVTLTLSYLTVLVVAGVIAAVWRRFSLAVGMVLGPLIVFVLPVLCFIAVLLLLQKYHIQ